MASPQLRVICIKWGTKYSDDYVTRLQSMCSRHLSQHQFLCITDRPVEGVRCRRLICDLPGWWQKVGLFQPGLFPGDNLYLDLDLVITESLQPFLDAYEADRSLLWTLDDFGYSLVNKRQNIDPTTRRLLGGDGTVNSSVMLWHGDTPQAVWNDWRDDIMDELHGDQNWVTHVLWPHGIGLLPPLARSYKYGQAQKAPVVVFHGDPKPHQVSDPWVAEHWR